LFKKTLAFFHHGFITPGISPDLIQSGPIPNTGHPVLFDVSIGVNKVSGTFADLPAVTVEGVAANDDSVPRNLVVVVNALDDGEKGPRPNDVVSA
jgi:hypothetical protein